MSDLPPTVCNIPTIAETQKYNNNNNNTKALYTIYKNINSS